MKSKKNEKHVRPQQKIFQLEDDFALIKNVIEGDDSSFKELVTRHREKVRNLIYLTLGDTDAIDDIAQDVFVAVYRKIKSFRFQSQFTTWLYRITVNKCRDHLRKVKIRSIFSPYETEESSMLAAEPETVNFDTKEIVQQAVAQLPGKLRIPLILRDFEGMSYQEIAETMNTETGTVKSRLFRAREGLRKILAPYEKELL